MARLRLEPKILRGLLHVTELLEDYPYTTQTHSLPSACAVMYTKFHIWAPKFQMVTRILPGCTLLAQGPLMQSCAHIYV